MRGRRERRASEPRKNLLGFTIAATSYALDIGLVREVVLPQPLTPLPNARPEIAGVANHRGEVVPVLDLGMWLGRAPASAPRRGARWIVIRAHDRVVALVVDAVIGPLGLEDRPRPPPASADGTASRGVAGIGSYDGRPLLLLDAGSILEAALREGHGPAAPAAPSRGDGAGGT
jgi:purine-binding chemotaxis protein CheW